MPDLKFIADHLRRDAYLYVRQSTLRQVAEHGESTQRQYALRDQAIEGMPQSRQRIAFDKWISCRLFSWCATWGRCAGRA
jgi:hypothetical protein